MPDIMARAGCRLRRGRNDEPNAPARTSPQAIGPKTGLVHEGTYQQLSPSKASRRRSPEADARRTVPRARCAVRRRSRQRHAGGPALALACRTNPTPAETLANGADIVTFSGDKLLGGPQAGIIVGRADLIDANQAESAQARAARRQDDHRRACRRSCSLYRDPDRLAQRLPTLRLLTRPVAEIARAGRRAFARRCRPSGQRYGSSRCRDCESQIGSGALPTQRIASAGLAHHAAAAQRRGTALRLPRHFARFPIPVIGRDCRTAHSSSICAAWRMRRLVAQLGATDPPDRAMIVATAGHVDHGKTLPRQGADRRRHRPPAGRETPRHDHRSRLCLPAAGRGDP